MPAFHTIQWILNAACVFTMVTSYILNTDSRTSNDISLDFDQLERLGRTDNLIKELKKIAQNSHDCGVREVPQLRRKFLSNDTIKCNDGSPAGYYIRKSYGSKKWIIFLEGGWYCFDTVSCQMRASSSGMKKFTTSKGWPKKRKVSCINEFNEIYRNYFYWRQFSNRELVSGILSWNPEENPYYFHSNVVYIPYCSSDFWSGTLPLGADGNEFAFMGSMILEQVIKDLIPRGLDHATKLILTGSSAGGIGVLLNLDRVANQMAVLAPEVEVRGIVDSGWFLDYPQYHHTECTESSNCGTVNKTKRAMKMWHGRVPEACKTEYPIDEHWRCYFGYRVYKTLKTPVYVIQHLFDEAQILVDNVFEQTQIRGDTSAAMVTKQQWQYLHKLGQEVRKSLENVSAVFAPSCLSHEVLIKTDWFNVSINNIKLGQSIYCWENSYKYDKCLKSTNSINSINSLNDTLQGDSPKMNNNSSGKKRSKKDRKKRRKRKREKEERKRRLREKRERRERKRDNRANKRRDRKNKDRKSKRRRSRRRRHQHTGNCFHHLIDSCPLPQCNGSCPKYRDRYTGDEMDFLRMFIRYGIGRKEAAELLGEDESVIERMDDEKITKLVLKLFEKGS